MTSIECERGDDRSDQELMESHLNYKHEEEAGYHATLYVVDWLSCDLPFKWL